MMTWQEFQLVVKEHWKVIVIVVVVLVCVIVAIAVSLALTVGRDDDDNNNNGSVTPTVSRMWNGPPQLNGDPPNLDSSTFTELQIVDNTYGNTLGSQTYVHDAGFVAMLNNVAGDGSGIEQLVIFQTNLEGKLEFLQTLTDIPNKDAQNRDLVVVDGAFAPIFNVLNEVYYLFLTLGVAFDNSTCGASINNNNCNGACVEGNLGTNLLGTHCILYAYDTSDSNARWRLSSMNSIYTSNLQPRGNTNPNDAIDALVIPVPQSLFQWNSNTNENCPFIGTFGDKIKVVTDDNDSARKHSVYIRGSEYSSAEPGGGLYWFFLTDNTVNPNVQFNFVIKDAKLSELNEQNVPGKPLKVAPDYINGFGADFFITTGLGKNNVLLISNPTNEDYGQLPGVSQPAMPNGYVQAYTLDQTNPNLQWVQKLLSPDNFANRFDGVRVIDGVSTPPESGFGTSCAFTDNVVIIGSASPLGATAEFLVFQFNSLDFVGSAKLQFSFVPDLYPQVTVGSPLFARYTQFIVPTESDVLFSVFNNGPGNMIEIATPNDGQDGSKPFSSFRSVQVLDSQRNSQLPSTPFLTRYAFAQGLGLWTSQTGETVFLAVNDPVFDANKGRIILYGKKPSV